MSMILLICLTGLIVGVAVMVISLSQKVEDLEDKHIALAREINRLEEQININK